VNRYLSFVSDPRNLPRWTNAFKVADGTRARLETPAGVLEVALRTEALPTAGTIDWRIEFPDRSVALAQSRVTTSTRQTCIYSFVLHAPPVALEHLEGALKEQSVTLRDELSKLKALMEAE
jgi:hypothetical protein